MNPDTEHRIAKEWAMKSLRVLDRSQDLPWNWQDCSREELTQLAEHGSYGQRLIANRYLREWNKDHPSH